MVDGLAVNHRVGAAGVVADAPTDAGAVRCGWVRGIVIAVGVELAVEVVQYDAGLDPCPPFLGVHLQQLVHVLAEVEHQPVLTP